MEEAAQVPLLTWGSPTSGPDVVQPNHPCSPNSFAIRVPNDRNAPEIREGDVVVIDPLPEPRNMDWVLAVINNEPIIASFIPREVSPIVYEAMIGKSALAFIKSLGAEIIAEVEKVGHIPERSAIKDMGRRIGEIHHRLLDIERVLSDRFDLCTDNLTTRFSFGPDNDVDVRIIGVVTEHSKRRRGPTRTA